MYMQQQDLVDLNSLSRYCDKLFDWILLLSFVSIDLICVQLFAL